MVERMPLLRVVATPRALDGATVPADAIVMRIAPDEMLMFGDGDIELDDQHAIIVRDTGWSGVWLDSTAADRFFMWACDWELPSKRPGFAQGMVAHLAAKLWIETDRTLVLVPSAFAVELGERLEV